MRSKTTWLLMGALLTTSTWSDRADACGGCFAPPGAVQLVTDHRMVLAFSTTQSTLWDQFAFTGRATDFSWILPIRYTPTVHVGIADERFLTFTQNLTVPTLTPPSTPFRSCFGTDAADGAVFDSPSASDTGVVIYREETVGPYAVAIVGGTDAMAIRTWLTSNGFSVPPAVVPVIDYYTGLSMDFIALRLRAGVDVGYITPIRVTVPGAMPTLPLRMISAGVGDSVGLSLVIFAESRMEAMNFPNGEISESDLTYDFDHPTSTSSDFLNAFNRLNVMNHNRLWLTESSEGQSRAMWEGLARFAPPVMRPDAGVMTDDAGISVTPDLNEDVRVAFTGLGDTARVTRLRANLPAAMLDRDLILQASVTTATRSRYYTYGTVLHTPVPPECPDSGFIPPDAPPPDDIGRTVDVPVVRDGGPVPDYEALAESGLRGDDVPEAPRAAASSGGVQCSTTHASTRGTVWLVAALASLLLASRRRASRRI